MSEVSIPHRRDELEDCLARWEDAIEEWQKAQQEAAEEETMLKAWEAATKSAYMANKMSAVMAEAKVRSHPDWSDRFLKTQKLGITAEAKKRILKLAEAKWETERSRQVSLRALR